MGKVCILKSVGIALISFLGVDVSHAQAIQAQTSAAAPDLVVRDLVTETLIRGLEATEIKPVPATAPACLLIAGVQGKNGSLAVGAKARLLTVSGEIRRDTMRELSVKFGASGLKVGQQLVILTSDLEWTQQRGGEVLTLGFERGPFNGFFNGAPHFKDGVQVARWGDELCVAAR